MATAAKKKGKPLAEVFGYAVYGEAVDDDGLDLSAPPEDGEPDEPKYIPPTPSADDKKTAEKVYTALKKADILGADAAISGLLQLLDVHPQFCTPEEWPGDEDSEYCVSERLESMAEILAKGCPKITIKPQDIVFLWRNKEKWLSGGKTVRGNVKSFPKRVVYLLEGKVATVEINYHHWKTLNPLQRAFSLYHELRQLAPTGATVPPEFSGFYDEMEVFGPRVFREMMELQRVVEIGSQVQYQHQLSLFEDEK
jgi:hypothetical protein